MTNFLPHFAKLWVTHLCLWKICRKRNPYLENFGPKTYGQDIPVPSTCYVPPPPGAHSLTESVLWFYPLSTFDDWWRQASKLSKALGKLSKPKADRSCLTYHTKTSRTSMNSFSLNGLKLERNTLEWTCGNDGLHHRSLQYESRQT